MDTVALVHAVEGVLQCQEPVKQEWCLVCNRIEPSQGIHVCPGPPPAYQTFGRDSTQRAKGYAIT